MRDKQRKRDTNERGATAYHSAEKQISNYHLFIKRLSCYTARWEMKRRKSSNRETRGERQRIDESRTTAGMYIYGVSIARELDQYARRISRESESHAPGALPRCRSFPQNVTCAGKHLENSDTMLLRALTPLCIIEIE